MQKPSLPTIGSEVFVTDDAGHVLLIRRTDNGFWAMPGGLQDLGETPMECAVRECREESGYEVRCTALLGVFSSLRYEFVNYPWKDREFCHVLFHAEIIGGQRRLSEESSDVAFFPRDALPPLADGHPGRIEAGFLAMTTPETRAFFE